MPEESLPPSPAQKLLNRPIFSPRSTSGLVTSYRTPSLLTQTNVAASFPVKGQIPHKVIYTSSQSLSSPPPCSNFSPLCSPGTRCAPRGASPFFSLYRTFSRGFPICFFFFQFDEDGPLGVQSFLPYFKDFPRITASVPTPSPLSNMYSAPLLILVQRRQPYFYSPAHKAFEVPLELPLQRFDSGEFCLLHESLRGTL